MSEEKKEIGIAETKEVLVGVNELVLIVLKELQDGFQLSKDLPAIAAELFGNETVQAKLQAAYEGVGKVDDEIKDLSLEEGLELAMEQVKYVQHIISILNSKKES